jgi:acylphosphatase
MFVGEERSAKRYYISGIVQGVGFRYFAGSVALRLEVAGYARNLADGRVEVYAVGSPAALAALRSELGSGPRAAVVERVAEEPAVLDAKFAEAFSIEYDA